VSHE
jgi:hypothetical protein